MDFAISDVALDLGIFALDNEITPSTTSAREEQFSMSA
jgi:hypothetical protein